MVCRLTGTPDQEAVYEVIGADEETRVAFSRALRQRLGLMRLGIADRWDRDLRLVQGGALDRYMEGQQLRQSILQAILNTPIHDRLGEDPKKALGLIDKQFSERSLPHPVRLGLVGTPGVSLAASVGLMVGPDDESALPLPAWGTGTRRLASLELASILADSVSLAVVDEPESGLEPYRQRAFIGDLHQGGKRQAFITTHAPAILSEGAALGAVISRINQTPPPPTDEAMQAAPGEQAAPARAPQAHKLSALEGNEIGGLLKWHPEAVLARLPVICEGITEAGFATRLLIAKFGAGFPVRGVFCIDGGGHDRTLAICKALLKAGFQIAAVADDEGRRDGSWEEVGRQAALLRWQDGAAIENAMIGALPDNVLPQVVSWPEEVEGREARHCLPELRTALGAEDSEKTAEQLLGEYGRDAFVEALCTVACPPREGNRKPKGWFKSFDGGYLLAGKLLALDPVPAALNGKIAAFHCGGGNGDRFMTREIDEKLHSAAPVVMIEAAGGCGKTTKAAKYADEAAGRLSSGKVLLLSHTHAACGEFQRKCAALGKKIDVETCDSFCLKAIGAYARPLGLPVPIESHLGRADGGITFPELSEKAAELFRRAPTVARAVAAHYPVIVLDEHQDTSIYQHETVSLLREIGDAHLRIFGDPMQAIHPANDNSYVDWDAVWADADDRGSLEKPHRWADAPELGEWVMAARTALKAGEPVRLRDAPACVSAVSHDGLAGRNGFRDWRVASEAIHGFLDAAPDNAAILAFLGDMAKSAAQAGSWRAALNEGA